MEFLSTFGGNVALGMQVALSFNALFYCFLGVLLGTFIGVLPGMGALAAVSILMPLTFYLDPTTALIMLAGIYYGAAYGGSTASILLNLPGTASSAVTCLDGYPMAKQGRAGVALFMTTFASFVGSVIGAVLLAAMAPPLASIALRFGSPEFFCLMVLGLLAASLLATGSPFRALTMVTLGLILGLVGVDINSGQNRYTFGMLQLYEGLPLVAIALALFGLPEIIANAGRLSGSMVRPSSVSLRSMVPTREDWRRSWKPILRGTGIGSFFGILPGTGGLIASFMSYAVEKRIHKDPSIFGKGAIEGVASPEASNNSAVQTAFIPTLTLGIPGDAIMALMLGVLMIHGLQPGPELIARDPGMFWGLIFSFLVGNVILLILNIPLIGIWVRILTIPYRILFPSIIVFVCIGVYTVNFSASHLYILLLMGIAGYFIVLLKFEPAPLILGFILGPMLEENLRRSMLLARGDPTIFITRPISGTIMAMIALLLLVFVYSSIRNARRARSRAQAA